MTRSERIALWALFISIVGSATIALASLAFPDTPLQFWRYCLWIMGAVFIGSILFLALDIVVGKRRPDKKMDPLLTIAIVASFVAFAALTIFAVRGGSEPELHSGNESTPDIYLEPPQPRQKIVWRSGDISFQAGTEGKLRDDGIDGPAFRLENKGETVSDVRVHWQVEMSGVEKLVLASKLLSDLSPSLEGDAIRLTKPGRSHIHDFSYAMEGLHIPFLTGAEVEALPPWRVYQTFIFYTIALMKNEPAYEIDPLHFAVSVKWNLPNPGVQKFIVYATAKNAKPPGVDTPSVDAFVSFDVKRVQ